MTVSRSDGLAAAVTVYRPDMTVLTGILDTLVAADYRVYVYVDGPTGEAVTASDLSLLDQLAHTRIIQAARNSGIAAGLNRVASAALDEGWSRLVIFDQDSDVRPGLVEQLTQGLSRLQEEGRTVAAVGPMPVAAPGSGTKAPTYRKTGQRTGSMAEVTYIIVSGCCMDLAAWRTIGPFLEDLRMDGVDVEWSFRAKANGYGVWCDEKGTMPHRVGNGLIRLGPVSFPRQSEPRMLNYVRSQAILLRARHVPLRWKLRSLAYVPLQAVIYALHTPKPFRTAWLTIIALADGLRHGDRK